MNRATDNHLSLSLFLFIFFLPVAQPFLQAAPEEPGKSETLRIATWNIRKFSTGSRDNQELTQICSLLQEYDFIAVQEVLDSDVLDRTVTELFNEYGKTFEYVVSGKVGRGMKERYAFLYNADRVFWDDNIYQYPDNRDLFIREPFAAGFQAGNFDFVAITVHIIWGDSVSERRAEVRQLEKIYRALSLWTEEGDIFLMGDFNLPASDTSFTGLRESAGLLPVNTTRPTSIRDRQYDNIWYSPEATKEFTGVWEVVLFDETMFGNDDKTASRIISDHRPLWMEIVTAGPDDD